jgi:heat-inducible transcriptional repressor
MTMGIQTLDERSCEVLKSLIQAHIQTGEPVGSETLVRRLARPLSAATVRNIMAELERKGYLSHPHTSAGRVPTDDGYRFYVDSLMGTRPLPPRDAAAIRSDLRARGASTHQMMENASHLLSRFSRNVGFVLAPNIARTTFRRIDLVRLPHPRILVVLVSQTGLMTQKVIDVEENMTSEALQACENYLNAHFAGMCLSAIRGRLLELMREEKALYDSLLKNVLSVGERAFTGDEGDGDVYLDGTANILDRAEFEDLARMRALFMTFEEKGRLVKILNACISGPGVRVIIGHENPEPDLRDLSLVTAAYPVQGEPGWALGVMGSMRMEYVRVVALVGHVAREVSAALTELSA